MSIKRLQPLEGDIAVAIFSLNLPPLDDKLRIKSTEVFNLKKLKYLDFFCSKM